MLQSQRRIQILEILKENGSCKVQELSELFQVSEPTIRNDLNELAAQDTNIIRQHGGAYIKSFDSTSMNLVLNKRGHEIEKDRIGKKAASLINDGDSIIFDSGTTISAMVPYVKNKSLNILTNAINIALYLSEDVSNNVILIGGELKMPTLSLSGNKGIPMLNNLHVNKLFLATGALDVKTGLSYPSFADIEIKKAMMSCASEIYLLADSSKIGKTLFVTLGNLENITCLITDKNAKKEDIDEIESLGIKVYLA